MKCVILAGGFGTRISEYSDVRPKPMIEIGNMPILWHIMKSYSVYGINDFIICLGYKSYVIKEYFSNYYLHMSDVTFDMSNNNLTIHQSYSEPWRVTLIDTGINTMTGGRLKRAAPYIDDDFCFTYGDGVSDVDISGLVAFHFSHNGLATLTAVQPPGRFGGLSLNEERVSEFREKPAGDGGWINGGFFVLSPNVLEYIEDDSTIWEREPMEKLAAEGQLHAYKHYGFWHAMDTLRDKNTLDKLWDNGQAPWKKW